MTLKLSLLDRDQVLAATTATTEAYLAWRSQYALGNHYQIEVDHAPVYLVVQLEASIHPALIYLEDTKWNYDIPFNLQRESPYPDGAFLGKNHYATVRFATPAEIDNQNNLSENSYDQHHVTSVYPHASSNAETRGETVFYAQNAIDGLRANESHGNYPFQSWGINEQQDAYLRIDFGRLVDVERIGLVLRADYPHDSYWKNVTINFSDGSQEILFL